MNTPLGKAAPKLTTACKATVKQTIGAGSPKSAKPSQQGTYVRDDLALTSEDSTITTHSPLAQAPPDQGKACLDVCAWSVAWHPSFSHRAINYRWEFGPKLQEPSKA